MIKDNRSTPAGKDRSAGRNRQMKTLYLECAMGAAGDMLTAALAKELNLPLETVREAVRKACR